MSLTLIFVCLLDDTPPTLHCLNLHFLMTSFVLSCEVRSASSDPQLLVYTAKASSLTVSQCN